MVKMDLPEDRAKVIDRGPWMITGCYLAVKKWSADFNPSERSFGRTMVWVRLSALNFLYYDEHLLKVIAEAIGKPIHFDLSMARLERGNYAWIYVEIDLSALVMNKV